jgi:Flp pilus assembly protein TadD
MGTLAASKGNDEEAVRYYDRSLAILPLNADAHYNRGNSLVRAGRIEEAKASYRMALRFDPLKEQARVNLGRIE